MKFNINNKDYSLKATYDEVLIQDAIDIINVDITYEDFKEMIITDDIEYPQVMMDYMIKVLVILSDCDEEVFLNTDPVHIIVLFNEIKYIVTSLHYMNFEEYKPRGIKEFRFKDKIYKFPDSIIINNEEILFHKEPSKNVIEVSNLMQVISEMEKKGIELLPLLCAVYLREVDSDDDYDEIEISKRALLFKELPISIAYDVFFYTYYSLLNSMINTRIYLEQKKPTLKERVVNLIRGFYKWLNKVLVVLKKKLRN